MTACKLMHTTITLSNLPWSSSDHLHGPMAIRTVCETHGWHFQDNPISVSAQGAVVCPLGRIEEATEEALRRIEKALEGKNV